MAASEEIGIFSDLAVFLSLGTSIMVESGSSGNVVEAKF